MPEACEAEKNDLYALVEEVGGTLSTSIKAISDRYQPEFDRISGDAPDTGGVDTMVDLDIDVDWRTISIALDLPEVTMTLQDWSLDLPQVTMRDKRIVFHTPSVRMERKKIGQYPVFHGWRVRWKDIYADVPVHFMQEHEIIMGIPEVRMDRTSIKLDIPEFTMRTQELKFDVPQITVRSISVEAGELKEDAEEKADEMRAEIAATRQSVLGGAADRIAATASTYFTCMRTQIQMRRDEIAAAFEPGIAMTRSALSKLEDVKANAEAEAMRERLADLMAKRDAATVQFDAVVAQIAEQERTVVDAMMRGLRGEA